MHTGGLPGYVSRVMMIPEAQLGIAVLTNQESGAAFDSIAYRIADHYLGGPATDWIDAYQKATARLKSAARTADTKTASDAEHGLEAIPAAIEVRRHLR